MEPSEQGLVLGPEQLGLLWAAFDDCWDALKAHYGGSEQTTAVGRLRLANALLASYQDGVTDRDRLKDAGMHEMRMWGAPAYERSRAAQGGASAGSDAPG